MNSIKNWFWRLMAGRYGHDKLNAAMLWTGIVIVAVALFVPHPLIDLMLHMAAYTLMGISLFRMFSRNTYKRYRENQKFLMLVSQLKDRDHRYYQCPRCRQPVRVPRGKGKIAISCPKCQEKFIKRT